MARSSLNLGAFLTGLASVASGREQALQENRMEAQQQQLQSWQSQMQGQQADEAGLDEQFGHRLNTLKMMMSMPDLTPESQQALAQAMQQVNQQYEAAKGQTRQYGQTLRGQDPRIRRVKGQMPPPPMGGPTLPAFAPPTPQIDRDKPAKTAFASSLDNWFGQAQAEGDNENALEIQSIQADLAGGKIDLPTAKQRLTQVATNLKAKGQGRQSLAQARNAAAELQNMIEAGVIKPEGIDEANLVLGALRSAKPEEVEAALAQYREFSKKPYLQPSTTERLRNDALKQQADNQAKTQAGVQSRSFAAGVTAALTSKNPDRVLSESRKYWAHFRQNQQHLGEIDQNFELDPTPRAVMRRVPVQAMPGPRVPGQPFTPPPVTYEEVEGLETQAEADARVLMEAAKQVEDPKAKAQFAGRAFTALTGLLKDKRLSPAMQDDLIARLNGIAEEQGGMAALLPTDLKLDHLPPDQKLKLENLRLTILKKREDIVRARQSHTSRLNATERRLKIAEGTVSGKGSGKYSDYQKAVIRAAEGKLRNLQIQYREALRKADENGQLTTGDMTLARFQQVLSEAEAELEAAIQSGAPPSVPHPPPPRAAPAAPAKIRVKIGSQTFSLTPEQARARGIAF